MSEIRVQGKILTSTILFFSFGAFRGEGSVSVRVDVTLPDFPKQNGAVLRIVVAAEFLLESQPDSWVFRSGLTRRGFSA